MAEDDGQGAAPLELYNTTMEMMDLRRMAMKRATRAQKLRAALTNLRPILANEEEACGYNNYGGDIGQNSHLYSIFLTYNPRWTYHEHPTYGGDHYQAPQCPQYYLEQSQGSEPSLAELANLVSSLAKDTDKLGQDEEVFSWGFEKTTSTWGASPILNSQPEYLDQGSYLGKEPTLTDLVNTLTDENMKTQQEMRRFTMEVRDSFQAMSTEIAHLTQNLEKVVKNHEELPAQADMQPISQDNVMTLRSGRVLTKEIRMPDADEALPKDTDEAEEDAEECKEEKIDDPAQEQEKEVTRTRSQRCPRQGYNRLFQGGWQETWRQKR